MRDPPGVVTCFSKNADLEEDAFDESVLPICQHLIRSYNNKFLILNDEEQFEAQNLTTAQQRQPGKTQPNTVTYCPVIEPRRFHEQSIVLSSEAGSVHFPLANMTHRSLVRNTSSQTVRSEALCVSPEKSMEASFHHMLGTSSRMKWTHICVLR